MKERLVGAAVLIAIGVWLIPWVLDGPDPDTVDETRALALPAASEPAPVRTRTIPLDAPDTSLADAVRDPAATADTPVPAAESPRSQQGESASRAAAQTTPPPADAVDTTDEASASASAAEPQPAPEPAVAQSSAPSAASPTASPAQTAAAAGDWMVQLGSFGQEENARRLGERISGYGYSPDISAHRAGGRTMHRVRIGPYETRERAEAVVSSLAAHGFVAQVVVADGATP